MLRVICRPGLMIGRGRVCTRSADRAQAKVRELRAELLQISSDADKKLGEETAARAVAEREAGDAKKQLTKSMQKYHEKEKRIVEVRTRRRDHCPIDDQGGAVSPL